MRTWTLIDRVATADGTLELHRRAAGDFLIFIDGRVLMNSRAHGSEVGLASLGCRDLVAKKSPAVLIGGLGMAYTLRAALDLLPQSGRVVVAEINPTVVEWCQGPLAELTGQPLRDRRVEVRVEDVVETTRRAEASGERFDAVLLDLYEGPGNSPAVRADRLYGRAHLRRLQRVVEGDGVVAVWCEQSSQTFERNLRETGYAFERHRIGRGGRRHVVYVARRAVRRGDSLRRRKRPC